MAPAASAAINTAADFALKVNMVATIIEIIESSDAASAYDAQHYVMWPRSAAHRRDTDGVPNRSGLRQAIVKKG